jgi:hypothetical protein
MGRLAWGFHFDPLFSGTSCVAGGYRNATLDSGRGLDEDRMFGSQQHSVGQQHQRPTSGGKARLLTDRSSHRQFLRDGAAGCINGKQP